MYLTLPTRMFLLVACPLILSLGLATAQVSRAADGPPFVFTFEGQDLAIVRTRIAAADAATIAALEKLLRRADRELTAGPYSVTSSGPVPPNGDPRDYMSQAPYWWPNPKRRDGLPFVRRDGEVNPASHGGDDDELTRLRNGVFDLSLAWQLTGDARYARRAAEFLRVWFIAPETRMKPRLKYAQYVPGLSDGRAAGIVESRKFLRVLDSVGMLAGSETWTAGDQREIERWFRDYLNWLRESERGDTERAEDNNHGTWYDAQATAFALFVGDKKRAREILDRASRKRFRQAIDDRGRPVHELERTRSLDYSLFNLDALMHLATLDEHLDRKLWKTNNNAGQGLAENVAWIAPYAAGQKRWPYEQIAPLKSERIAINFRRAAVAYQSPYYEQISRGGTDPADDSVAIELALVYPLRE
jgi:hypothetical protein